MNSEGDSLHEEEPDPFGEDDENLMVAVGDLMWHNPDGIPRIVTVVGPVDERHARVTDGEDVWWAPLGGLYPAPPYKFPKRRKWKLSPDTIKVLYWGSWFALGGALSLADVHLTEPLYWLFFAIVCAIEYLNKKR